MDNHLDTSKSVMISAPAGSGKTQKLAGRYIALMKSGVDVERILAVTFTEKAAAEMKQRILSILAREDEGLFRKVLHRMPLMRVLTLHAFCGTLLRRFSFEAAIDPNYKISDTIDSAMNWEEALYQVLMDAGRGFRGHELLYNTLGEKGFRGLDYLRSTVDYLYQKSPFSLDAEIPPHTAAISKPFVQELLNWSGTADAIEGYKDYFREFGSPDNPALEHCFLTGNNSPRKRASGVLKNIPDFQDWASGMYMYWKDKKRELQIERSERIRDIFGICLHIYGNRKYKQGVLDFSDLEYVTYKMLTENPEWANILYAFDEKTDHILVDEFQDINSFQWEIINSLTEEWRAGMGAKRDEGIRPTVFFVGDVKQSIYYFRGANVEIFSNARDRMARWLGNEFLYEEARENYRSRPAIIEFTNNLFKEIMKTRDDSPSWITRYSEFEACREGDAGQVELIMLDSEVENTAEAKEREADILARKIKSMINNFQIAGRGDAQKRPCKYEDIAILLRKRTHLRSYEEALRRHGIPFVAVKGIGFYQEPEVAVLRSLVYFLSNPGDDYSLYILLKSPLFGIDDNMILEIINNGISSLFKKMQMAGKNGNGLIAKTCAQLDRWLSDVSVMPVAELMETVLIQTGAWQFYHKPQARANIRKLMRIIEELEAEGKTIIRIRDFLERTLNRSDEPKANVNTEGMDAVKIMTIHTSKGLEFPVVFVPGLEEPFHNAVGENLIYEHAGQFFFKSEPESSIRKEDDDYLLHLAKEKEEQKRLFYVAVTRAEEALVLSGRPDCRANSFMGMLNSAFEIESQENRYSTCARIPGFSIFTEKDIRGLPRPAKRRPVRPPDLKRIQVIPLTLKKQAPWKGVTESTDIKRQHGKEWHLLGDVMHRILEGVSKGELNEENINEKADRMLASRGVSDKDRPDKLALIKRQIDSLQAKGVWKDIIRPQDHAYTELPFVLREKDEIYSGRIDRVIRTGGIYNIYDYKTFPVEDEDVPYYLKGYAFQLGIYKKAVMDLFVTREVKTFIVFTHDAEINEI
jgi:ATP-dependent helicase/nuclease subunit A